MWFYGQCALAPKIYKIKIWNFICLSMIDKNPITAYNWLYKYKHALYAISGLYS